MADETKITQAMREQLAIAEKLAALKARGQEVDEAALANASVYVRTLESVLQHHEQSLSALEKQKERLEETDARGHANLDRQIKQQKELAELAKKSESQISKVSTQLEKHGVNAQKTIDGVFSSGKKLEQVSADMTEKSINGVTDLAGAAAGGVEGALESIGGALMSTFKDPRIAAILAMPGLGTSLENYRESLEQMPSELDQSVRGLVKETGLEVEQLGKNLVFAMDPMFAKRMGVAFQESATPLKSIGLTAENTQGAIKDLLSNTAMFRPSFMKADAASATFITNLVGGMAKIGVSTGTSSKLLNTFTKALKESPVEAGKSLKKIANIADSLGMSAGEVANNFENMSDNLAMYGGGMTNVMAELQAQAIATGVDVNKLASFAEGLDTFDGAAQSAQSLNAVLGGTFLSVTDLVNAEPADKIAMIQDAIANAGIDFENADRRMKQVISSAAGFDSVADAMKVLGNTEAAEDATAALNTQSMTQEELSAKINDSMTITEQMNKGMSNLAGGMQQILDTVRPGAVKFANVVESSFGTMLEKTENSAAAVVTFQGTLGALEGLGNLASQAMLGLGNRLQRVVGILGANPAVLEALGAMALGTAGVVLYQGGQGAYEEGGGLPGMPAGDFGEVFSPEKTDTGGGNPVSALVSQISENTTSIKDLTSALNEKSDIPINLSVQSVIDGVAAGEASAQTIINILSGKAIPAP
tara:strand:+ start:8137 stop:10254 length:2118 start_codon:yes stop_codon:yes gene_type:complete